MTDPVCFLIVAFDGLRPDMVTAELTPNLCAFQARGTTFANHRASFPSDTRANIATLMTGTHQGGHGLGNAYLERAVEPKGIVSTADADLLETMDRAYGGRLFGMETLGEMLGRAGRKLAVVSGASRGSTRLLHHKVKSFPAHLGFSSHFPETSWPAAALREITERFGPLPPPAEPDLEALAYTTDVFLDHVWPRMAPDLTVLWFNEPDTSYHRFGVGSAEAREATAAADAHFGRILSWWEKEGHDRNVQILVMSDHGHVDTIERIDVVAELAAAGFNVSGTYSEAADLIVVPGASGQIYVRDGNPVLTAALAEFVMAQPWCGLTFSAGKNRVEGQVEGTFARSLVLADHGRSPDFLHTYRSDDGAGRGGLPGRGYYFSDAEYASMHGGLHKREMSSVGIIGGSLFREGIVSACHSGAVDIAPTILTALGEPVPPGMQGRVLDEALRRGGSGEREAVPESFEAGTGHYGQVLHRVRVGDAVYVDCGSNR